MRRRWYYGVRLSYALSDWIDLGKKYPAALAKLKGIRDEKTSRLLAGEKDREIFDDVVSINDHLGESEATVELFKQLDVAQPDFAASVYDLADEALVSAREYGLAKKYLGDPIARLESAKRNFDEGMEYAKTSRSGDASRKAFERIFADEIVRVITLLDKTGSPEAAREVQSKALTILEAPAIRDAIPLKEIPERQSWIFDRLFSSGVLVTASDGHCFLDEAALKCYRKRNRTMKAVVFVVGLVTFLLFYIILNAK